MKRTFTVTACGLAMLLLSCATRTWYARVPEAERSAHLAHQAIRTGMTLPEVVGVMVDVRSVGQLAAVESGPECPEVRVNIVLHAGEMLAHVGSTRVYAAGFASIVMDSRKDQSLKSWGFRRQGDLMDAVRSRENELLVCGSASVIFDAVTEGGCGHDTVDLRFDAEGKVTTVSPVRGTDVCGGCAGKAAEQ